MTTTKLIRVNVYLTLAPEDLARWATDQALEESLRARLEEVYDDDGAPVFPHVLGADIEEVEA